MSSSRRSLCRRRYDELSDQFFAEIDDICKRCRYRKEEVDRSMKRLLKIAESRDPTPNDLSLSAALSTVTKDHLEYFFCVIRNLVGQPCDDIAEGGDPQPNDLSDVESLPPSDVDHPSSSNSDVVVLDDDDISSSLSDEEQFEVEKILSRTVNAEGKYVYHVKWLGYDTTSDPENFVDEENMNCPELIKEFEREERRKKKERARKLEEQAMLARKKKEEAERRAKAIFESPDQSSTDNERTSCRVLNLCSSTSCSEDEDYPSKSRRSERFGKESVRRSTSLHPFESSSDAANHREEQRFRRTSECGGRHSEPRHKRHAHSNTQKRILTSDEDDNVDLRDQRESSRKLKSRHLKYEEKRARMEDRNSHHHNSARHSVYRGDKSIKARIRSEADDYSSSRSSSPERNSTTRHSSDEEGNERGEDDGDPWGGFKYVTRESDAFEKGYKAIKVSVVTEHPVTGAVVGVVVFKEPSNDREFAQYISLRKIQKHAPQELRQYFVRVSSLDEKNIALALLLQTPNKVF
ncbi:hypothetical protein Q1695_005143 [Nippostrongylus brasiliensis]|nr:hypothetical protein Q1695_005143 [Nippostrongylus brasiliensis]